MKLSKEEVMFKSLPKYYGDEEKDLKNHTERIIDWEDPRFHVLELMRLKKEFGFIRIICTELDDWIHPSFRRRIRHICKWENIMIVTWEANKCSKK